MTEREDDRTNDGADDLLPVGDGENAAPRRAASAEFLVTAEAGSEAALREAMDPANQSFADALKLSYRILQLGILALVAVFLFSGFQTVEEGDLGVKTRFGAIEGVPGDEQVGPGLHPYWPYPIGEVLVVPQVREVELLRAFWPVAKNVAPSTLPKRAGIDDLRTENEQLRAGLDGYILTAGGDIAHCEIRASYEIQDAASFLRELSPAMADQLVTNALERGMVLAGATFSLTEFIDLRDTPNEAVQSRAQEVLDALDSGIELKSVRIGQRTAPLAIRAQYRDVQVAREEAKEAVERARQEVATSFTAVAGEAAYSDLIRLIDDYNNALTGGEIARADGLLDAIGERFEKRDIGGSSARIINQARAYQSALETRLSSELRRIETLAPTYRENPKRFVQRIWLETYREVFENDQLEVFSIPLGLARIGLSIQSSEDIMQLRRDAELDRKKAAVLQQEGELLQGFQWGRGQIILEGPGRRLERNATGGLGREN